MKFAIRKREDQEAIIHAASLLSDYHWSVCVILLDTGCHPSNVYDVRDEGDVASWHRVKNEVPCMTPTSERLSEAIRLLLRDRKKRGRLSRQHLWNVVRAAATEAGTKNISPVSLRKSFCLNRLMEGETSHIVAQMMGCGVGLVDTVYCALSYDDRHAIAIERGLRR